MGLVAFVLARLDLGRFVDHVRAIDYPAFVAFIIAILLVNLGLDALATGHVYRRVLGPIRFGDFLALRAASYLPSLVNHHVGQAWLTYFLSRAHGVRIWRATGATLLVYATTLGALVVMAGLSLVLEPGRFPWLPAVVAVGAGLGVVYLAVIALGPRWLADRQLTAPLVEVGVGGHLTALAIRLPNMGTVFLMTWVPFLFFGIDVPLGDALVLLPPLLVLVALPITPAGVGTRDALATQLLAGYAVGAPAEQRAAVAASTLTTAATMTIAMIALSLIFSRRAHRLLAPKATA